MHVLAKLLLIVGRGWGHHPEQAQAPQRFCLGSCQSDTESDSAKGPNPEGQIFSNALQRQRKHFWEYISFGGVFLPCSWSSRKSIASVYAPPQSSLENMRSSRPTASRNSCCAVPFGAHQICWLHCRVCEVCQFSFKHVLSVQLQRCTCLAHCNPEA